MRLFFPTVLLIAGLAALWNPSATLAWNSTGHETVAMIAYDQLSPADRKAAAEILGHHPRYEKDLRSAMAAGDDEDTLVFIAAATWPDTVRNLLNPLTRRENHPAWHYVDFPYVPDPTSKLNPPAPVEKWDGKSDPANLMQAMQKVTSELRNPATPLDRRAIDLCWVLHLAGDIHQPLHAVSLFSKDFPDGDRGGNSISDWVNGEPMPLHAVWDDLEGNDVGIAAIMPRAQRIEKVHPPGQFTQQLQKMEVKDWAMESFEFAKKYVYLNGHYPGVPKDYGHDYPDEIPPLSANYMKDAQGVADVRVALAGYRLAALLPTLIHTPMPAPTAAH